MPSSRYAHIPMILDIVRELDPSSILDVGIGFGKWGHLFREYTDIASSAADPERYSRVNWRVNIDGIEGYPPYITEMHRFIYNEIHVGDMCRVITDVPLYDVVFLGDVLEHVEKHTGQTLVAQCIQHARKAVIITTPAKETSQGALCGNELEVHRSLWAKEELREFEGSHVTRAPGETWIAVILRPGLQMPWSVRHWELSGPQRIWLRLKRAVLRRWWALRK